MYLNYTELLSKKSIDMPPILGTGWLAEFQSACGNLSVKRTLVNNPQGIGTRAVDYIKLTNPFLREKYDIVALYLHYLGMLDINEFYIDICESYIRSICLVTNTYNAYRRFSEVVRERRLKNRISNNADLKESMDTNDLLQGALNWAVSGLNVVDELISLKGHFDEKIRLPIFVSGMGGHQSIALSIVTMLNTETEFDDSEVVVPRKYVKSKAVPIRFLARGVKDIREYGYGTDVKEAARAIEDKAAKVIADAIWSYEQKTPSPGLNGLIQTW